MPRLLVSERTVVAQPVEVPGALFLGVLFPWARPVVLAPQVASDVGRLDHRLD